MNNAIEIEVTWIECYKCGISFGVPSDYECCRKRDGRTFWCPNGHGQIYPKRGNDGLTLEERQELIVKLHKEEQAEARAAETHQQSPPLPADAPDPAAISLSADGGRLVCSCGKRYKSRQWMRRHLSYARNGGHDLGYDRATQMITAADAPAGAKAGEQQDVKK